MYIKLKNLWKDYQNVLLQLTQFSQIKVCSLFYLRAINKTGLMFDWYLIAHLKK